MEVAILFCFQKTASLRLRLAQLASLAAGTTCPAIRMRNRWNYKRVQKKYRQSQDQQ